MNPVDILIGTKDVLEKEGWVQGNFNTPKGYCIIGAFNKSFADLDGLPDDYNTYSIATRYASDCCVEQYGYVSLIGWNDQDNRVKEDVLNLLDCAIEKATKKQKTPTFRLRQFVGGKD